LQHKRRPETAFFPARKPPGKTELCEIRRAGGGHDRLADGSRKRSRGLLFRIGRQSLLHPQLPFMYMNRKTRSRIQIQLLQESEPEQLHIKEPPDN